MTPRTSGPLSPPLGGSGKRIPSPGAREVPQGRMRPELLG